MLDCAPLNIVSVVCLTIQAPVAEGYTRWSRKPEIPGSIPGRVHFSFSLYYLPMAKQFTNIYNSEDTNLHKASLVLNFQSFLMLHLCVVHDSLYHDCCTAAL